jgi:Cu(I)/Ag(I) efflux system membrane fusion protein
MINRGDKILDIYSPDVSTAEDQLIQLLKNDSDNISLIQSVRQKLLLLDLSNEEIDKIIRQGRADQAISIYSPYNGHAHAMNEEMMKTGEPQNQYAVPDFNLREGMYVQAGQTLLSIYNIDEVWALISTDALNTSLINTGLPVTIVINNDTTDATVDYIEPLLSGNSKFITIRAYLKNESRGMDMNASPFKIGQLLTATIQTKDVKGLWLPPEAIFNIGSHEVVWLKAENTFTAHEIKTGIKDKDFTQVLDGLSPSDTVAANAGLLNDNDSFIRTKN